MGGDKSDGGKGVWGGGVFSNIYLETIHIIVGLFDCWKIVWRKEYFLTFKYLKNLTISDPLKNN